MLAGEVIFYNRFSNKVVKRIDMEDIDIEKYKCSPEFYKTILDKRIGRVITSVYYTNDTPIETLIYEYDLSRFTDISIDKDTNIINTTNVKLEGYEACYQSWFLEGIFAESLIFHNQAVEHLSDEELEALVGRNMVIEDPRMTIKRGEKYTFVNFNFYVPY